MIGLTLLGTSDLDRAKGFYDALLDPIGMTQLMGSDRMCAWGTSFEQTAIGVITPLDGEPATVANGSMVSIQCPSGEAVQAMHAKALELGGADEGAPGPRGPEGQFYAAYFRDLDGHKLLAFHRPG